MSVEKFLKYLPHYEVVTVYLFEKHLKSHYPWWDKNELVYRKGGRK